MAADVISFLLKNDAGTLLNTFHVPLNKLDATAAPAVGDDELDGYVAGSMWVDRTNNKVYVCQDNSTGAAVWAEYPGSGADIQTLLDGIGNTQGDVLYYNGTDWVVLGAGTAGQVLKTGGAGANPSWLGSANIISFLAAANAAAANTVLGLGTGDSPQFAAINLSHASANTLVASGGHMAIEGSTVWDSGNDGPGSGLNADLLDGYDVGTSGNAIPILSAANTWSVSQTQTFLGNVIADAQLYVDGNGLEIYDSDKSHRLTVDYTSNITAARTLTLTTGDANRALALTGDLTVTGTASISGTAVIESRTLTAAGLVTGGGDLSANRTFTVTAASSSDMATGTSTTVAVIPNVMQYHASATKAYARWDTSSGTPTNVKSYGVTGYTDMGGGDAKITFTTGFASGTAYAWSGYQAQINLTTGGIGIAPYNDAPTATVFRCLSISLAAAATDATYNSIGFWGTF